MKHSLKISKPIQRACILVLAAVLVFSVIVSASPVKAQVDTQDFATTTESAKIKAVIKNYFTQRYETEKTLLTKPVQYSKMYSSVIENADAVWMQKEQDRLEVLETIASATKFNFTAYKFSLVYKGIQVSGNKANVTLLESNELTYAGSSEPSLLGDLPHTITLKKNAIGLWRITNDDYLDDTLKMMSGMTKAQVLNNIHYNLAERQQTPANTDESLESPNLSDSSIPQQALTAYAYHPSYAIGYADANWNRAGGIPGYIQTDPGFVTGWKTTYKLEGATDCTNFVSQAIFLGANGTDTDANYFYPNPANYNTGWYYKFSGTNAQVGGSLPWVYVGALYNFLTTNKGRGPYGTKGGVGNVCGLVPGDVILMQDSGNTWQHAVIMRAKADNCAYAPYAWVDAHTTNRRNVPLSNYAGYVWYPVHIVGYRK